MMAGKGAPSRTPPAAVNRVTGRPTPDHHRHRNTFLGGTSIQSDNSTFTLAEFSYRRFLGDAVQPNQATPGGDGNEYVGNFRVNAVMNAIPEPATWAMMIGGFGMIGAVARRSDRVVMTTA